MSAAYACGVYTYVACSVCVVAVEIRCMVRKREGGRERGMGREGDGKGENGVFHCGAYL